MNKYRYAGWYLLRTANLSIEEFKRISTARGQNLLKLAKNLGTETVLKTSAGGLLEKYIKNPHSTELNLSMFNLLSRMTFRSTPFGTFAGVSLGEITEEHSRIKLDALTRAKPVFSQDQQYVLDQASLKKNPSLILEKPYVTVLKYSESEKNETQVVNYKISTGLYKILSSNSKLAEIPRREKDKLTRISILQRPRRLERPRILRSAKNANRVELVKDTCYNSISKKSAHAFLRASEALVKIFSDETFCNEFDPYIKVRTCLYNELADGETLPLLDLLKPERKFLEKIQKTQVHSKKETSIEQRLMDLICEKRAIESQCLVLNDTDLAGLTLSARASDLNTSLTCIGGFVRDHDGTQKQYVDHIRADYSTKHFSRYIHSDKRIQKKIEDLVQSEISLHPDKIFAEVVYSSTHPVAKNITPFSGCYTHVIPIHAVEEDKKHQIISLDDLYLKLHHQQIVLFSKKLKKEIVPILPSLLNFAVDTNPIVNIFAAIEIKNSFYNISWSWGNLKYLHFFPRVQYNNVILSFKKWRLAKNEVQMLRRGSFQGALQLFEMRRIPLKGYLITQGQKTFYDLADEFKWEAFKNDLPADLVSILLEEYVEPDVVRNQAGSVHHSLVIPFLRRWANNLENNKKFVYHSLPHAQRVFNPGSPWTYLRLYMSPLKYPEVLKKIRQLKEHEKNSNFFFLPFRDAQFHLRLRVRRNSSGLIQSFAKRLVAAKIINRFEIGSYHREVERYGGLNGVIAFESISREDSLACLKLYTWFSKKDISVTTWYFEIATLTALNYLNLFGIENVKLPMTGFRNNKYVKDGHERAKKIKRHFMASSEPFLNQLWNFIRDGRLPIQREVRAVIRLSENGKLHADLAEYMFSMIHLSLVRIDFDLAMKYELLAVKTAIEIYKMDTKLLSRS